MFILSYAIVCMHVRCITNTGYGLLIVIFMGFGHIKGKLRRN